MLENPNICTQIETGYDGLGDTRLYNRNKTQVLHKTSIFRLQTIVAHSFTANFDHLHYYRIQATVPPFSVSLYSGNNGMSSLHALCIVDNYVVALNTYLRLNQMFTIFV